MEGKGWREWKVPSRLPAGGDERPSAATVQLRRMIRMCMRYLVDFCGTKGRFHRLGLTLQLANPRLRDN